MSRVIKQAQLGEKPVVINNPKITQDSLSVPAGDLQEIPELPDDVSQVTLDLALDNPQTIDVEVESPDESLETIDDVPPVVYADLVNHEDLINQEIENAKLQAQAMIDEAETKAAQIIEEANKEMAAAKEQVMEESRQQGFADGQKQGWDEGYQEGLSKGKQEALDQMQEQLNASTCQAAELIQYATKQADELLIQSERQMVELSLSIAQKIIAQQLDETATGTVTLVKAALAKVRDQEQLTIRVNPADYERLLKAQNELDRYIEREHVISLAPDQTLANGGCIIETAYGSVDARVDSQLDALKKALQEAMP
ncbi:FliH/SctL family protein [Acetonema longum]|uniref:Flagellar assembly protein FliH/type III secretion system HrpE n=1 Tax=Acetonema longum DSM 6540 TaxID=1009370 RepID=F7NL42_9FIRM|nr:FliH/SctL family protein [Acetonema longum]EGO63147.1 flagellar assembly protein FliH/type III secretion system HrpE [Acetonema longum DSM 6540]